MKSIPCENKYVEMLKSEKIKAYQLESVIYAEMQKLGKNDWSDACKQASEARLEWIESKTQHKYPGIKKCYMPTELEGSQLTGIENKLGGASIPIGFSGPIKITGEYAKGEFFVPMATNEAALIAGNNRGVQAINLSGGINTVITKNCMTRAPVVELGSIGKAKELVEEINKKAELYEEMKKAVEPGFTKLIDVNAFQMGRRVWIRNVFDTSNAMGMNAVTKHSAAIIKKIQELRKGVKLIALSGNMCTDKKASHVNVLLGKGKAVEGEVVFPREVIEKVWKTTPEAMIKVNDIKNWQGSALSGTITGFNANAANPIAAFFAATGQDLAHVATSSTCFNVLEIDENKNLRYNISLPNLEVGSLGGGMFFGTAKECLSMIGCSDKDDGQTNAKKVAEILTAVVAAQEINLLGALANEFELAESHVKLARGEKK
ncbi:3-hydroxy-3-methylglutaryl-CoA reductase [Candidatus Micrarchaeota archaeon]|nr:3-hydroxy-3-methylglutaryl-CoA reductase [Candidatus Micrarchaeota archaeon]